MSAHQPSSHETNGEDKPSSCTASAPFDDTDADVVFRTSDGVNFHVHKIVLSLASPFFKDMFSLTQAPDIDPKDSPIIIAETAEIFDSLLRLCYPIDDPTIQELSCLENVIQAAVKYQMAESTKICRAWLKDFVLKAGSLAVFAAACRLQLEDEARFAAQSWKDSNSATLKSMTADFASTPAGLLYTPEIGRLPAGVYFRLISFCQSPQYMLFSSSYFLPQGSTNRSQGSTFASSLFKPQSSQSDSFDPALDIAEANVILRSSDGQDFPYHTLLLRLASVPEHFYLVTSREEAVDYNEISTSLPVKDVRVKSPVLEDLLRILHPSTQWEITSPRRLLALLEAAVNYEMTGVITTLRNQTNRLLPKHSLAVYLIATQCGWRDEAKKAAHALLEHPHISDKYDPIMEEVLAAAYYSLLRFHHTGLIDIADVVKGFTPHYHGGSLRMSPSLVQHKLAPVSLLLVGEWVMQKKGARETNEDTTLASHSSITSSRAIPRTSSCSPQGSLMELLRTDRSLKKALEQRLDKLALELLQDKRQEKNNVGHSQS